MGGVSAPPILLCFVIGDLTILLSRAPLRVSFFGGGSDLPSYFLKSKQGGVVLSTAIDKYMYLALIDTPKHHVKLMYSEIEIVNDASLLKHDIVRHSLDAYGVKYGIEIGSFADMPTSGTGLGSSSTFAVALLNGLNYMFEGEQLNRGILASKACEIEISRCEKPIGYQDQFAAAYGGTNLFQFRKDGFSRTPIEHDLTVLSDNLMMFYTDQTRSADTILAKQSAAMNKDKSKVKLVDEMVELTYRAADHLINFEYDAFGSLLDETWSLKKQLAGGISNESFDRTYASAIQAGALGGKLLGAGGGGFFLFYVPIERQEEVRQAVGLEQFEFRINAPGADVVYDSEEQNGHFYEVL